MLADIGYLVKLLSKHLTTLKKHKQLNGLGNYFVCKRFAVQTLLWSLELVIQINFEHDTITVWKLAQSWSITVLLLICGSYMRWSTRFVSLKSMYGIIHFQFHLIFIKVHIFVQQKAWTLWPYNPCNSDFFASARKCQSKIGFYQFVSTKMIICAGKKNSNTK